MYLFEFLLSVGIGYIIANRRTVHEYVIRHIDETSNGNFAYSGVNQEEIPEEGIMVAETVTPTPTPTPTILTGIENEVESPEN